MNLKSFNLMRRLGACLLFGMLSVALPANAEPKSAKLGVDKTASSKKIVTDFFNLAFVKRQPIKAAMQYISPNQYIQHNPEAPNGRAAFIKGFPAYVESSQYQCQMKRVIAENDLVVVHSACQESAADLKKNIGSAVVDIFRVENNLIVEHWDVLQAVPSKAANQNSMF